MRLTSISLENFRNYKQISVDISSDLVLILGANASGKTNFLESIYFLSLLKSFRSPDQFLVKSGENYFRIEVKAGMAETFEVVVQTEPILKRAFKLDGQRIKRGLWKSFATVLFVPQDLNLFSFGPAPRRRYLDDTLSQISKNYSADLASLDHVLLQRKKLLEKIFANQARKEELAFWDEQLMTLTMSIGSERKGFLDFLNSRVNEAYKNLTGFQMDLQIEYKTYADSQLTARLREYQEAEIRLGQNLVGPHREDFLVKKQGQLNVYNSSRGELRAQILAIKLLQAEYLDQHDQPPVILLDDVFSELDEERRIKLLAHLSGHQIFITTTEEHHLPEIKNAQIFTVKDGKIE
ncbi:MAG: DNA replication and repair protein RecF [Candidatus Doudnabacteria bacterium]|nr:DNA replication and repair protein RecF [Candidatus Doudnabacteria bacterium]